MHILVVDGFEETVKGRKEFKIFRGLVVETFKACFVPDAHINERKLNRLGDIVVDWEHDVLNDQSRDNCKRFDKFDFVFVGGDMHICPWEPIATQVVTLIHMCKFMKKPLFCSGFGAFTAVYSMATKGARFHVLNGPIGDEIERLAEFPRYSIGTGAYPSGWLDNETGDLYTYNRRNMSWEPVCNLGIYRVAANGPPSPNRHPPLNKKYARDDHLLDVDQIVEPLDVDAAVARIRSTQIQHYSVKGFKAQNCILKCYSNWYLQDEAALPSGEGLQVVADGEKGTLVLAKDNMLMLACKIDKSVSFANCQKLVSNFVTDIIRQIQEANRDKLEGRMLEFLFGKNGMGEGSYDSIHNKMPMSPPLSRTAVRTTWPDGPVKVDPPAIGMFLYTPTEGAVDYLALTSARRNSTIGRVPNIRVQNPLSARQKRMDLLVAKCGGVRSTTSAGTAGSLGSNTVVPMLLPGRISPVDVNAEGVPEQVKELFTGILMDHRHISHRRAPRTPVREYTEPPSLERLLADALAAPATDFDREAGDYELDAHMIPFGESLIIPGTTGSVKRSKPPRGFSLEQDIDEDEVSEIMLHHTNFGRPPGSPETNPAESQIGSVTANNVPFAAVSATIGSRSVSPLASMATSSVPQQPATPRSSASAARLASRINKQYRQRAMLLGAPEEALAEDPEVAALAAKEAYERDSSEDEAQSTSLYPLVSALSVESVDNTSAWSSNISAGKVPMIANWNQIRQQANESNRFSQSARSPDRTGVDQSMESQSSERKRRFYPHGTAWPIPPLDSGSSILAPTQSSMHRSSMASQIARVDPATSAYPSPRSARTASEITSLRCAMHLPVQRPRGPIMPRDDFAPPLEDGEEDPFPPPRDQVFLPHGSGGVREEDVSAMSRSTTGTRPEYCNSATQQVLITTPNSSRPYSAYRKITSEIAKRREDEQHTPYTGAYRAEFHTPDETLRAEYMKSREKFLAGPFKTAFGPANSSLQPRKEGCIRPQGPFPLEPAGNAQFLPPNATAAHFAALPRSTQPPLAGAWK